MNQHRCLYIKNKNGCNIALLFDKYGVENCNIILIESIEANNKMELHQREAYYIRTLKCINKNIPLRTDKEWQEDNKDKLKEYQKQYYENEINKNKMREYQKQYREQYTKIIKEKKQKYYQDNKNKFYEYQKNINKNKRKNTQKKYSEANKDKIKQYQKQYRESKKNI
jgi:hypothetical protein